MARFAAVIAGAVFAFSAAPASAATRFVAPGGVGSVCSVVAPCGSLEGGYRAAAPGDVVEVAGGTYSAAQVVPALGRVGAAIELRPALGASVVLGSLDVRADHVVVRGMRSLKWLDVDSGAAGDVVEDVRFFDMQAKTHWVNNARDFSWTRGSIGPNHDKQLHIIGGTPASYRLSYDGVLWHDATRSGSDVHTECLMALGVQGLTIRNGRFSNCAVFDILLSRIGNDPAPRDITIENTVLEASKDLGGADAYYSMQTGSDTLNGLVLRNNVWELALSLQGDVVNGRVVGNVGETANCRDGVSYSHNVFAEGSCGSTDRVKAQAFSQFVNSAAHDWRLKAGAAAIDAGDPADFPATDADGNGRPAGKGPDAGPYEFGSHPVAPGAAPPGGQTTIEQVLGRALRRIARVLRVLNGEALRVRFNGGRRATVRLLGVDAPPKGRCGAAQATRKLRRLVMRRRDHKVTLVGDPAGPTKGRVAAYVRAGRVDVNQRMISSGWAKLRRSDGAIARRTAYRRAQRSARRRRNGLWRRCTRR